MDEYNCWLQADSVVLPAFLAPVVGTVVAGRGSEWAAEEFQRGIKRLSGTPVPTPDKQIYIGTVAELNSAYKLNIPAQKREGFYIKVTDITGIIAGEDYRGTLYGVYRFLALAALGKLGKLGKLQNGDIYTDAPAVLNRIINHWDDMDGSIERGYAGRSLFFKNNQFDYDPQRIEQYARLLASIGIAYISLNNVNVRGAAKYLITEEYLPQLAKVADIFRLFGIHIILSVNFAAPCIVGDLPTADPLDEHVRDWWKKRADSIYQYIPDLAGFLVKADSEFEPGPFQYGRTHADGANMLAAALEPHKGTVFWRCFVYNCTQDWRDHTVDRARAAYDNFMPLDGSFAANVTLQIKFGPYDFQVSEPVSPLFGALTKTNHIMELQITQEYTGQQIDLCFLPWLWERLMRFNTGYSDHATIQELMGTQIGGFTGVANVGLDGNWTGHTLAQANLYSYGRLSWDPTLSAATLAQEWSTLTFGAPLAQDISAILLQSYPTYQKYTAPFGVCFMVNPAYHYGPNVEGYEFSKWGTYHRADREAIGIDRTEKGTGYTAQYAPPIAEYFAQTATCPEELLLFFHRVRYDYRMKNGDTLLQNIYTTHFEGYEEVQKLYETWLSLEEQLDKDVFKSVKARFERQLNNAREWRDVINTYFYRKTGIPDSQGRTIYD
ncbi:alpha-glucuronidase [Pillotina sp. SPG140]|jgi:alpha-glucuronidase